MSAGLILSQLEALISRMQSMERKISERNIRPKRGQLEQFDVLRTELQAVSTRIDAAIIELSQPTDEGIEFVSKIRSAKAILSLSSPMLTTLSKNLYLIFNCPKESNLDSAQVRMRKRHTQTRCEKLRHQHPHVIAMWSMELLPSTWKTSRGMADKVFDFLISTLKADRFSKLPSSLCHALQSLSEEEPLNNCTSFQGFASHFMPQLHLDEVEEDNCMTKGRSRDLSPEGEAASNKRSCTVERKQLLKGPFTGL
ncbi:hypothetical protein BDV30DRAFT_6814 [Aspergillus minisclerotigenes]|uniref:Uncharacterized protein n=1 Tax=Aspergillus minisclerotigenes TaxID=656917 RepID=A0A5N6JFP0_9EURO|nr:hypothetical protein BDV30DRAFT_6814 [Aspergillus minisclerotigenes]